MYFVSALRGGPRSHTYVTELFGVDGGLNHNWRIRHLCKLHCVWMLPVSFLQIIREKHFVTYRVYKTREMRICFTAKKYFISQYYSHRCTVEASSQLRIQA